jgi:hypothetical protein
LRRERELRELAGVMYAAQHKPDQIEKFIPKAKPEPAALNYAPGGEPDFEEWWKTPNE